MAGKWKKAGARVTGAEQVERKLEGKLHDWDFLPIGQKIGKMESLLSALKSPSGEFKFLSLAGLEELMGIESRLAERLKAERHSLDDMREVFEHYGVDLGKAGVRPEDISYPHETEWKLHKEHGLLVFKSPATAKWIEDNMGKGGLQPSHERPPEEIVGLVGREKAFGFGKLSAYEKFMKYFPRKSVDIHLIQPLVFYKRIGETRWGQKGTSRAIPLENPDLLLFYAQLREAKGLGAKKVRVLNFPKYVPFRGKMVDPGYVNMPFRRIYQRINQMSGNPSANAEHSVFMVKKKR